MRFDFSDGAVFSGGSAFAFAAFLFYRGRSCFRVSTVYMVMKGDGRSLGIEGFRLSLRKPRG